MKSILESTEKDLKQIFDEFSSGEGLVTKIASRGFVLSKVEKKKVLFVGINPSYPEGLKPQSFSYNPIDAVANYSRHFKKFQDLSDSCNVGNDWTYIDLLFLRETDQRNVMQLQNDKNGLDFLCQQLQVSFDLIENLNPDLIVVCNSGARTFFGIDKEIVNESERGIWMGYDFIFDDRFGVDVIIGLHNKSIKKGEKSTNLLGTPVLFTSTLTYMDNSTKKRLVWQIKQILNYHSLFFGSSNYKGYKSERLNKELKILMERLIETKTSKLKSVSEDDYENAFKYRTEELNDLKEIVKLLLISEKQTIDNFG